MIPKINAIAKNHKAQYFYYLSILMISNIILLFTEPMGIMARLAFILLPLGIQGVLLACVKKPGLMFLLLLPKSIIDAFQFVLLVLYGYPSMSLRTQSRVYQRMLDLVMGENRKIRHL